jgi:hypothetical protein
MSEKKFVITRKQFEKLCEIFKENSVDQVIWKENNNNGIGPVITVEYQCQKDLTDHDSW